MLRSLCPSSLQAANALTNEAKAKALESKHMGAANIAAATAWTEGISGTTSNPALLNAAAPYHNLTLRGAHKVRKRAKACKSHQSEQFCFSNHSPSLQLKPTFKIIPYLPLPKVFHESFPHLSCILESYFNLLPRHQIRNLNGHFFGCLQSIALKAAHLSRPQERAGLGKALAMT